MSKPKMNHLAACDHGLLLVVPRDQLPRQFNNPKEVHTWLHRIGGRRASAVLPVSLSIGTPLNAGAM